MRPVKLAIQFRAKQHVASAIKKGEIEKPKTCSRCGKERRLDGHHPDYRKPLDVIWLCRLCHRHLHYPGSSKRYRERLEKVKAKEAAERIKINKTLAGFPTDNETFLQIKNDREALLQIIANRNSISGTNHIRNFYRDYEEENLIHELVDCYV